MDIFKVDICIGSIIDFIGFDTISISFLVTANWFFSHSHFMNIKGTRFSVNSIATSAYIVKHNYVFSVE